MYGEGLMVNGVGLIALLSPANDIALPLTFTVGGLHREEVKTEDPRRSQIIHFIHDFLVRDHGFLLPIMPSEQGGWHFYSLPR